MQCLEYYLHTNFDYHNRDLIYNNYFDIGGDCHFLNMGRETALSKQKNDFSSANFPFQLTNISGSIERKTTTYFSIIIRNKFDNPFIRLRCLEKENIISNDKMRNFHSLENRNSFLHIPKSVLDLIRILLISCCCLDCSNTMKMFYTFARCEMKMRVRKSITIYRGDFPT